MPTSGGKRNGGQSGLRVAAIDAGSNAIRLLIAEEDGRGGYRVIQNERVALRLGRHVFASRQFDDAIMDRAVAEFRRFKSLLNQANVQRYRAVATSATREARNRQVLIERIFRQTGIRLEVIDGYEEARLIRQATMAVLKSKVTPQAIVDLGGGSMQVSILRNGVVEESSSLSLGTVRLMERFGIAGALTATQVQCIQERVETQLNRFLPLKSFPVGQRTVLCGGNAEALAEIFPGHQWRGIATLNFPAMQRRLKRLTSMTLAGRMKAYSVRKDRADVMAVAAVVLTSLGKRWRLKQALVPGVGLKEGVLFDVLGSVHAEARTGTSHAGPAAGAIASREAELLAVTRKFAARLGYDRPHCEHIAELAASLFDQTRKLHGMGDEMRLILRLGALVHDIGHAVGRTAHHRIGEYLVRHADLAGISEFERNCVACLVRYHSESEPDAEHKIFASLDEAEQKQVHLLVALLRIADRLDSDHQQLVRAVTVQTTRAKISLRLSMRRASDLTLWSVARSGALLEEELGRKLVIQGRGLDKRVAAIVPAVREAPKRKLRLKVKKKK